MYVLHYLYANITPGKTMAEVTGFIGNDQVELNNAATEATLKKLLESFKALNKSILELTPDSGGGASSDTTKTSDKQAKELNERLKDVNKQSGNSSTALSGFASGIGSVISGIGFLVGAVFDSAKALVDFGIGLMDGGGKLSGFYKALESLPGPLGWVAGLFAKIAEMQEAELETYQKMSNSGVNFGGSLTQIRQTALNLGMTLGEFGDFVAKNSKALEMMGGTTDQGARAFVKLSKDIRESQLGSELRGLGYTTAQLNNGMAEYIAITGGRTAIEMKDTKKLSESAGAYLKELDMMAELTGESREELEKKQKEASKNAAWQNYLQTLDEDGRRKANLALLQANEKGGKGAADALQYHLLGLPNLSDESQMFASMAGKAGNSIAEYEKTIKDKTKTDKDVNKVTAGMIVELANASKNYGTQLGGALIAGGGAVGQMTAAMLNASTELKNKNITTAEQYAAYMANIAKKQADQANSEAAAAANSEKAMKDLGASIYASLSPAIAKIVPIMQDLARMFGSFVERHLPQVEKGLSILAQYMTDFVKNMFTDEGRAKIINDLKYYFQLMMIEIKKAIIPWYSESDASKDTNKLDAQKTAFDKKAELAKLEMARDEKIEAMNKTKDDAVKEKLKAETDKLNAQIVQTKQEAGRAALISNQLNPDEAKILEEYKKK